MIQAFLISFRLKNTYRVNSILYSLKQIPLIKRLLPDRLYQSRFLKILGNIISILIEFCSFFLGKFLYLFFLIFSVLSIYQTNQADTFLHLLFFLTIVGALMNTFLFNPTKDKYYAMMLMNMDAYKYTLSNYFYAIIKVLLGFLPFTILFSFMLAIPLWVGILLPFFIASVKVTISAFNLLRFEKTGVAVNENLPDKYLWVLIFIFVALAYGLPYLHIVLSQTVFYVLAILFFLLGMVSMKKICSFQQYKEVYRQILVPNNVYVMENSQKMIKENIAKQIELDETVTSNKNGYAYFHELFVKRHAKILTKSIKKQCLFIVLVFAIFILAILTNWEIKDRINNMLLTYLPYFVFILYMLNRGQILTQAMFMNCDHSMLTYRIFRTPNVILGLFRERLKTLITINLIPALFIAIGLPCLLLFSGGTDNGFNYVVLFLSILSMSIFFSVHYLILYYLLQPYNINTEMKSSTYGIIQGITYTGCFFLIQLHLPTFAFGLCVIPFSILYSFVSLFIVYRYAPKTFRLRL